MQRFLIFLASVSLFMTASQAMAHPGHGSDQLAGTPAHYLLDPFHAAWTLLVVGSLLLCSRWGRRLITAPFRMRKGGTWVG